MRTFEIDKTHYPDSEGQEDFEVCRDAECSNEHQWSVYQRDLDRFGVGFAVWQSDHVSEDRAQEAAYAYDHFDREAKIKHENEFYS
jgi:hypothetical protein